MEKFPVAWYFTIFLNDLKLRCAFHILHVNQILGNVCDKTPWVVQKSGSNVLPIIGLFLRELREKCLETLLLLLKLSLENSWKIS